MDRTGFCTPIRLPWLLRLQAVGMLAAFAFAVSLCTPVAGFQDGGEKVDAEVTSEGEPSSDESDANDAILDNAAFDAGVYTSVAFSKPAEPVEFPTLRTFGVFSYPTAAMYSWQDSVPNRIFALAKFCVVLLAAFVWLSCLRVVANETVQQSVRAEHRSANSRWAWGLLVAGFLSLMLALVLPASAPAAIALVAGVTVPYSMFVSWQNSHQQETAPKLGWLPLLPKAVESKPVFEAIESTGDPEAAPVPIRFVGKSALRESSGGLSQSVEDSPAFQYVLSTISKAVASNATDLHVNTRVKGVEIKQRVDGTLSSLAELPLSLGSSVINIFKVMSELSIADRRRSQDGSFLVDVGERRLSFRVSSQATQAGEKLSIRILDPSNAFTDLASLGMPEAVQTRCERQLTQKHGLLLFAGATGAGKSTTACAAVQMIDTSIKNIVSIEDPIEYQIPSVDQIEVNLRGGQTFESALRSVLRLDADVIFIGEIRDSQTAKIAVQAAQTGQLVIATMHATDSVGGFQRLADLTGDATAVASTVRAIVAQTLVRKLCPRCRIEYAADDTVAGEFGTQPEASLYRSNTEMQIICPVCDGRRFMRRTAVYEITEATPEIRELVRKQAPLTKIAEASKRAGMVPLREQASLLVKDGTISINELNRVFGS
ncbi:MAG: hypothetical protein Aurels2KO_36990 [Aureliella sp.]